MNDKKCEKCGHDRWKTKKKNFEYQCRKCGYIRLINF